MMRQLLGAIQFLTILPVPAGTEPNRAVFFFPLVGAALGAGAAGVQWAAARVLLPPIAALLALAFLMIATGGLHEDGLADVFDAFRAGRSPERIHAILKDSRIGTYGALAIVVSSLLRWQAIAALADRALPALAAAAGASRGGMVLLAYLSKPAGEGLGRSFVAGLSAAPVITAAVQAAALGFLVSPMHGVVALAANALVILLARAYFQRRLGGVNGDCMGATCQILEVLMLLIFVCPLSF
jgi:adenosylcobinamide-GDP ribazoletransferase